MYTFSTQSVHANAGRLYAGFFIVVVFLVSREIIFSGFESKLKCRKHTDVM